MRQRQREKDKERSKAGDRDRDKDKEREREREMRSRLYPTPSASYYYTGHDLYEYPSYDRRLAPDRKLVYDSAPSYRVQRPRTPSPPRSASPPQRLNPRDLQSSSYYDRYGYEYARPPATRPPMRRNVAPPTAAREFLAGLSRPAIHVNPDDPKDMTVHMSLETTPDVESLLEHNARLSRLGHFDEAISRFEKDLASSLDNIYVRVQYGHCLYDARQYRKLAELAKQYPSIKGDGLRSPGDELCLNWNLLLRRAETLSELDFQDTIDGPHLTSEAFRHLKFGELDSTEVRI
jgi:hypothetical protein